MSSRCSDDGVEDRDSHELEQDGHGEEHPSELPKMKDLKTARKARLQRKVHAHQIKELQEERLKIGASVEGILSDFQESQAHVVELERVVADLKEREKQKALEIKRWQSSSDTLQKDSLRLKRQLAVVTERLTKAEETVASAAEVFDDSARLSPHLVDDSAEEASRRAVEQLQMRLADYEALVVEFADQANRLVDEDDLEPTNLSGRFDDFAEAPPTVPPLPVLGDGIAASAVLDLAEQESKSAAAKDAEAVAAAILAELESLRTQHAGLLDECSEAKGHAEKLSEDLSRARADHQELEARLIEATSTLDGERSSTQTLQFQLQESQNNLAELEQQGAQQVESLRRIEHERTTLFGELREAEGRATAQENQHEETEHRLRNAQEVARQAALAEVAAAAARDRAERDLDALRAAFAAVESEGSDRSAVAQQIAQQELAAQAQLQQLRQEHEDMRAQLTEADARHRELEAKVAHDAVSSQSQLSAIEALQEECKQSSFALESLRAKVLAAQQSESDAKQVSLNMQEQRLQAERNGLKALRRIQAADVVLNVAHNHIMHLTSRSVAGALPGKRERRREQTELALALTLVKSGHQVLSVAAAEVVSPQIETAAGLAVAEAEAFQEQIGNLHKKVIELEHCRSEALLANAKVLELQQEAAEVRTALFQAEAQQVMLMPLQSKIVSASIPESLKVYLAEERSAGHAHLESVQDQLELEISHFDDLIVTHQEVLLAADNLKVEKLDLERRLLASNLEQKAVRQELGDAMVGARDVVSRLYEERSTELQSLNETFKEHLQAGVRRETDTIGTFRGHLAAERQHAVDLESQFRIRLQGLERERELAFEQRQDVSQHLDALTQEHTALLGELAESRRVAQRFEADLAEIGLEREALEAELAAATSSLEGHKSEAEAFQARLHASELAAGQHSKQLSQEMQTTLTSVEAQRDQLLQELEEASRLSAAEEQHRATLEQQLADARQALNSAEAAEDTATKELSGAAILLEELRAAESSATAARADQSEVDKLRSALRIAETSAQEYATRHNNMEQFVATTQLELERHRQEKEEQLIDAGQRDAAAQLDVERLHNECGGLRKDIEQALHEQQALQAQLTDIIVHLEARTREAEVWRTQAGESETAAADLRQRLEDQAQAKKLAEVGERDHLAQELQTTSQRIMLEEKLRLQVQEQLEETLRNLADAEEAKVSVAAALADTEVELIDLRASAAHSQEQLLVRQQALDEAVNNALSSREQSEFERQDLQRDVDETKRELAELAYSRSQLRESELQAQQRCDSLMAQLQQSLISAEDEKTALMGRLQQEERAAAEHLLAKAQQAVLDARNAEAAVASQRDAAEAALAALRHDEEQWRLDFEERHWRGQQELADAVSTRAAAAAQCEELRALAETLRAAEAPLQESLQQAKEAAQIASAAAAGAILERDQAVEATTERLQAQMREEAQKYVTTVTEKARAAVAGRDQQILALSTQLQEVNARLQAVSEQLIQTQQREAQQVLLEGNALEQRLAEVSLQLSVVLQERDALQQQGSASTLERHQASSQCDAMQQQVQDLRSEMNNLQETLSVKDSEAQHAQLARDASEQRLVEVSLQLSVVLQERDALQQQGSASTLELHQASSQFDAMQQQVQGLHSERNNLQEMLSVKDAEAQHAQLARHASEQRFAEVSEQLGAVLRDRDALQQHQQQVRASTSDFELQQATEQCDTLQQQVQGLLSEQIELQQLLRARDVEVQALEAQHNIEREALLTGASSSSEQLLDDKLALEERLASMEAELAAARSDRVILERELISQMEQQREETYSQMQTLAAQNEELRAQQVAVAVAPAVPAAAPPASFDAQEVAAEREALEVAFRMQMEEAQRNLSAKTMEAETLRHQLAQVTAGVSAASAEVVAHPNGSREEHWQAEFRKMQLRMSSVEEEKAIMLKEMREHILQLARENYDLKQRGQVPPAQEDMRTVANQRSKSAEYPDGTAAVLDKLSVDDIAKPAGAPGSGGGGWLSYVLAPFLTDSDMREIHAESYVGEALKNQPLINASADKVIRPGSQD